MGTKNKPGVFDCYANADPDEPMFVLLGRDKHAPLLVDIWAILRAREGESGAKVDEAVHCAAQMENYRQKVGRPSMDATLRNEILLAVKMASARSKP